MSGRKYLIVNADDFGRSPSVNRGIIKAHECGIVTSASLMVRWPAAAAAAAYGQEHPRLSLGLHVDLSEWTYRKGEWVPLYEVVPVADLNAVEGEVSHQLLTFRRLVGKNPTHMDSHQHVHLREPIRSVMIETARNLGVPLRHCGSRARYCGDFYGQTAEGTSLPDMISVGHLIEILSGLPAGLVELGCHPGEGNDLDTMYLREREIETMVLCDPQVRAAIATMRTELCSFGDLHRFPEFASTAVPLES
jgi:predicted glycoside hydrolase/deacetylase ChbG (UPF0249 family)